MGGRNPRGRHEQFEEVGRQAKKGPAVQKRPRGREGEARNNSIHGRREVKKRKKDLPVRTQVRGTSELGQRLKFDTNRGGRIGTGGSPDQLEKRENIKKRRTSATLLGTSPSFNRE